MVASFEHPLCPWLLFAESALIVPETLDHADIGDLLAGL